VTFQKAMPLDIHELAKKLLYIRLFKVLSVSGRISSQPAAFSATGYSVLTARKTSAAVMVFSSSDCWKQLQLHQLLGCGQKGLGGATAKKKPHCEIRRKMLSEQRE